MKKELYIFLVSVLFTYVYEIYYLSNNFRDSVWDTFKRNFLEIENFLIGLIVVVIGYILFRFIFLITSLFLRKKDFVFKLKAVSISVFTCLLIYIVNDQLIFTFTSEYEFANGFRCLESSAEPDSSNFFNYEWGKKALELDLEPMQIVDASLSFGSDSSFVLKENISILDRIYLIRKLFNIEQSYTVRGEWIFENIALIPDYSSDSVLYSIQIRNNRLYLNTCFDF